MKTEAQLTAENQRLQQAVEEQALELDSKNRELEIETALERVRARAMAMQKSEELRELVFEFYRQIHPFGFAKWGFEIKIAKEDKSGFYCWISPPGARIQPEGFEIPTLDHWVLKKYWSTFELQAPSVTIEVSGEDKRKLGVLLLGQSDMKNLPEDVKTNIMETEYVHFSVAAMRFGLLKAVDMEPILEKDSFILQRFAKVFEQTYTRFLDLQKAEAQTREAQIEAALERVLSRTMGMQRSEEMLEVGELVYKELSKLGISSMSSGVTLTDPKGIMDSYYVVNPDDGSIMKDVMGIPRDKTTVMRSLTVSWEKQEPFHIVSLNEKETILHQTYIAENSTNFPFTAEELISYTPARLNLQTFNFKHGYLILVGAEKLSKEKIEITIRFTKVFEQTYTRFLDLQKAETQAREAQIEAALERVRARAMGLRESNELKEVIALIYKELSKLGLAIHDANIVIEDPKSKALTFWGSGLGGVEMPPKLTIPFINHKTFRKLYYDWDRSVDFHAFFLKGKEFQEYWQILIEETEVGNAPEAFIEAAVSVGQIHLSQKAIKNGFLEVASDEALTIDNIEILRRFGSVVDITYTRFYDILKAEAQAREAQIEAALERVRSRSMAMHKSEELREVVFELFSQMFPLGLARWGFGIWLIDDLESQYLVYFSTPTDRVLPEPYEVTDMGFHLVKKITRAYKEQSSACIIEYRDDDKRLFDDWCFEKTGMSRFPESVKQSIYEQPYVQFSFCPMKYGLLQAIDVEPFPEEHISILQRFTKVFEQTYTRFLDLQKAEAQAREAQIEAALERIRSRSMAMRSSEELREVVQEMYNQVEKLGISNWGCFLLIFDKEKQHVQGWFSEIVNSKYADPFYFENKDHEVIRKWWQFWESDEEFMGIHQKDEVKYEFVNYLFTKTGMRDLPEEVKTMIINEPQVYFQYVNMAHGLIQFIDIEPFSIDSIPVLKRITSAFEQAYTRFLDLQKAEAQAKEAEIQLALERIRAKAMAMRSSNELMEVANTLREQMRLLDQPGLESSMVVLYDEEKFIEEDWFAFLPPKGSDKKILTGSITWRLDENEVVKKLFDLYKSGVSESTFDVKGEDLEEIFEDIKEKFPVYLEYFDGELPENVIHFVTRFSGGHLLLTSQEEPNENSKDLQRRVTSTFDLAYNRFLDLQKAEDQAREAEIELALERVRSRTMAMHQSEELSEVAALLFDQLKILGAQLWTAGFAICKKEEVLVEKWMSSPIPGQMFNHLFVPYNADHGEQRMYDTWKNQEALHSYAQGGKELKDIYDHLMEIPSFKANFQKVIDFGRPLPVWQKNHVAAYKYGYLLIITEEEFEEENIFPRFAKVFEQTYTRFLDLEKAEAQARESQIEAALERVRARAMAMRSSDELKEVALELRKQMANLGQKDLEVCAIHLYEEGEDYFESWGALRAPDDQTKLYQGMVKFPKSGIEIVEEMMAHYHAGDKNYVLVNEGEKAKEWLGVMKEYTPQAYAMLEKMIGNANLNHLKAYWAVSDFKGGALVMVTHRVPDESSRNLLHRSATVFQLAYRRYLDLQKAEAQAREAEIQLALERVRARTMAMQKSDELSEVATIMFQKIQELGAKQWTSGFEIWEQDQISSTAWVALPDGSLADPMTIPFNEDPYFKTILEARQSGQTFLVFESSGKSLEDTHKYMSAFSSPKKFFEESENLGFEIPTFQITHCVFFSFGFLIFITYEPVPEMWGIFKRFANVFEQTYTRFLDLQKAEKQVRETQIEAALERVRSKTMGMHSSNELLEIVDLLYAELSHLDVALARVVLLTIQQDTLGMKWWIASPEKEIKTHGFLVPPNDLPMTLSMLEAWKNKQVAWSYHLIGKDKKAYDNYLFTKSELAQLPEEVQMGMSSAKQMHVSGYCNNFGILTTSTLEPLSDTNSNLLVRFGMVFEQTYTRFLDLQKAEAQAREAEIQLALERVRARTMAMQRSDELSEAGNVLFQQLHAIGIVAEGSWITLIDPEEDSMTMFVTHHNISKTPKKVYGKDHPNFRAEIDAWKSKQESIKIQMPYDDFVKSSREIFGIEVIGVPQKPIVFIQHILHGFGFLGASTYEEISEKDLAIYRRFTKVFEQTYTRFLDLQKAEAQARESQIEAALERVRSRTMAMQKSEELTDVAALLFSQVSEMGIKVWTAGFNVWSKDNNYYTDYITSPKGGFIKPYTVDTQQNPVLKEVSDARKSGIDYFLQYAEGEELQQMYLTLTRFGDEKQYEIILRDGFQFPSHQYHHFIFGQEVSLMFVTFEAVPEARDIFRRFGKVFEQTYTRFLDLQKAEAQARESQIQLALERVRARTMAMHKSEELIELNAVILQQVRDLNVEIFAAGIHITDPNKPISETWIGDPVDGQMPRTIIDHSEDQLLVKMYQGWKSGEKFIIELMEGDKLKNHFQNMAKMIPEQKMFEVLLPPDKLYFHMAYFYYGFFAFATVNPSPENHDIFTRFAKVFEQTYTRFLDLQKAEAQARESQIEAALERVRARTMAMHKSEELSEVASVLYKEFFNLGISEFVTCGFMIYDESKKIQRAWITQSDGSLLESFNLPLDADIVFKERYEAWKRKELMFHQQISGKTRTHHIGLAINESDSITANEMAANFPDPLIFYNANFSQGYLSLISGIPLSLESQSTLSRFAKVFEQTYTRFLDLQKAEAQSRESQIQLALERVRARTMAMHKSDELAELNAVILKQVHDLNVEIFAAGVHIADPKRPFSETWIGDPNDGQMPKTVIDHSEDPLCNRMYQGWKAGEKFKIEFLEGEELKSHFQNMAMMIPEQKIFEELVPPDKLYFHLAYFRYGFFVFTTMNPCPENHDIFTRFAKVFEQTYTRFLDLKKAEAQAREAQIEVALERVRSSAMAMQKSSHLKDVVRVMIENLNALDVETRLCEILLFGNNFDSWKSWIYVGSGSDLLDFEFSGPYFNHPFNEHHKNAFQKGLKYTSYVLEGEDKTSFDKLFDKHMTGSNLNQLKELVFPIKRTVFSLAFLSQGAVLVASDQPLSKEGSSILERFAKVVDFTYTRVEDLQKAEKRTLEAIKQSSLDRVRAEIASMRSKEDLQRITPLIWRELLTLGVPFFRCGLMIVDEKEEKVRFYLSTPDGNPLAALNLDFESNDISSNGVKHWRKQQPYIAHWNQEEFLAFTKTLIEQQQIKNPTTYQGGEAPPESLTLQFIPFPQGMLYVGSAEDLSPAQIDLAQNLANAFSVAYARYEDFKQLEDAKSQIELTLSELKSTQAQLIQSEKMASLGELTAGIAHEIQNPLNFVNNFSEVSNELLDEIEEERAKSQESRDETLVTEILVDIKENLIKINHHGKRADSIVKGMLEHSRTNKGEKAPTDLNALVDEFVRLSYHGLRAKDKSFNADFKFEIDPNLPKVNVVASDIGRVILNLVNNAFYAVDQRAKSTPQPSRNIGTGSEWGEDYKPEVTVKTTLTKSPLGLPAGQAGDLGVEITVLDNGNGIPESAKEKIFQPFFTTKPTGSGTGLGLSLSYDIIKAHGGDFRVKSTVGEGTEMTLFLPIDPR